MNIADRIQSLRKIKGISQEELADKIGVPDSQCRNGKASSLHRILKRLSC